jgi:hypothetical protein
MTTSKEKARQRYYQLKRMACNSQHATENGDLVPNVQDQFNKVKQEITNLERGYSDFEPFI